MVFLLPGWSCWTQCRCGPATSIRGLICRKPPCCYWNFTAPKIACEQSEIFGEIAAEHTPHAFRWTTDPEERTKLWKARHDAFWAAMSLLPGGEIISTDVCVPISRLAECVEETRRDIEEVGIIAPIVGHVGDGNFHTLPMAMPDDTATWAKIKGFPKGYRSVRLPWAAPARASMGSARVR